MTHIQAGTRKLHSEVTSFLYDRSCSHISDGVGIVNLRLGETLAKPEHFVLC